MDTPKQGLYRLSLALVAAAGAAALHSPVTLAQDQPGATSGRLDEIVVTARKREESLQDVPEAVSAFTVEQIESAYAQNTRDLEGIAPNLIIDRVQATPGGAAVSIRGLSFQDVEKSFDPAVGVVVDGVYLGTNTGAFLQIFDIERIEVLRGPQGTLFGKNTIGGTINVIRSKPTGEWGAKLRARAGNRDRLELDGVFNVPLIKDTLAAKLVYSQREEDGWYRNIAPGFNGDRVGDLDFREYGAALRFTPTEALTVDYSYYKTEDDSDAAPLLNVNAPTDLFCLPLNVIFPMTAGDPFIPPPQCGRGAQVPLTGDPYVVAQNFSDLAFINTDSHTLALNWELNDAWTLDYLFGWRESEERMDQDFDSAPVNQFSTIRVQDYEQQSHELRFTYDAGGRWNLVAGVYKWDSEFQLGQRTLYLFDILAPITPSLATLVPGRPIVQLQATDHENDSWAVFAQADVDLNDRWTLTLGGRFTDEEKQMARAVALNLGGFPAALVGPVLPAAVFRTSFQGGSRVFPVATHAVLPLFSTFGAAPAESWSEFTPKVGVRFEPNDDQMWYLSYSSGFRSGGFNGRANAIDSALTNFDPETVDNIELGYKSSWADGRVLFNAAVFTSKYDNKQEEIVIPIPSSGDQETVTQNASEAEISGVELEFLARPTERWTVRTNLGYLDASYDSFCADVNGPTSTAPPNPPVPPPVPGECGPRRTVASGVIIPTDNTNLELRRAPELTFTFDTSYRWPVGPGHMSVQAAYHWKDDYYSTFQNVPIGLNESYGLIDASIGFDTESWRVALFGRNLADEEARNSALVVAGLFQFATVAPDRQYGVEAVYRFGK
jgi:iron complex outermembrane receptor protein